MLTFSPVVLVMSRCSTSYLHCTFAIPYLCSYLKAMQNATGEPVLAEAGSFYLPLAGFSDEKLYLEDSLSFTKLTNRFYQQAFPPR